MRFRKTSLVEITARIAGLGLTKCLICGDEGIGASPYPVILDIGGFQHDRNDPRYDPEANIRFMVEVKCRTCGHSLLFDSEQLVGHKEAIISTLSPEDEEKFERGEL